MTERSPGRWRLQVTGDLDTGGPRLRMSRTIEGTRRDAREALQRLVVETGAGLSGSATTTVGSLLEQFMITATLAPSTRADWDSVIRVHLQPALGDITLWKLTARHCDQFYTRMAQQGAGPSRVRCAHVVLHRAVAQAVRWGWLSRNAVSAATRPTVPRTMIQPPSTAQVRALLAVAAESDHDLACWLQIAVATGARRGEVCALRWVDIDFADQTVRIERSVSATKVEGVIVKTTKTGGVRRVALTGQAIDALRALHARQEQANWAAGVVGGTVARDRFVFTSDPSGQRPWRPELVTRRWERIRGAAGLSRVRVHDLRHYVATELLTAGIDARTVANRLGHACTSTTLDRYWAWVPARDRDAADHLEGLLR
jgi:integrase